MIMVSKSEIANQKLESGLLYRKHNLKAENLKRGHDSSSMNAPAELKLPPANCV
jgi:hypothetical protein